MGEEIYLATDSDLNKANDKNINAKVTWNNPMYSVSYSENFVYNDKSFYGGDILPSNYEFENEDKCTKKISYGENAVIIINTNIENFYSGVSIKLKQKVEVYNINTGSMSNFYLNGNPINIISDSINLFAISYITNEGDINITMVDTFDIDNIIITKLSVIDDEIIDNIFYTDGFYYYSHKPNGYMEYEGVVSESHDGKWFLRKIERKNNIENYDVIEISNVNYYDYNKPDYLSVIDHTTYHPTSNRFYYTNLLKSGNVGYKFEAYELIVWNKSYLSPALQIESNKIFEKDLDTTLINLNPSINFKLFKNGYIYDQYNKLYFNDSVLLELPSIQIDNNTYEGIIDRIATDGKNVIACICGYQGRNNYPGTENIRYNPSKYTYIYMSTDGGTTWENKQFEDSNYVDVHFNPYTNTFYMLYFKDELYAPSETEITIGHTNIRYVTLNTINLNNKYSYKDALNNILETKKLLVENYIVEDIISLNGTRKSNNEVQYDFSSILSNPLKYNVNNFKVKFDSIYLSSGNSQPIITQLYDNSTGILSIKTNSSLFGGACKATIWILKNVYNE